jgi:kinesin family protein 5
MQRTFALASAGIEGARSLVDTAQDLERTRKAINVQLAEFDGVKKSLMRDLQNRCEKVDIHFHDSAYSFPSHALLS